MATLEEDVRGMIAVTLQDIRGDILTDVRNLTIEKIVDKAITSTVAAIEVMFHLESKGACEPDGQPHYCEGIVDEYWRYVNN